MTYTRACAADETHPIYVSLWDSAAFVQEGSRVSPIQTKPVNSKDGTALFTGVGISPAYVSAAYDPAAKWKAMSPAPSSSSLDFHASFDVKPAAVTLAPGRREASS